MGQQNYFLECIGHKWVEFSYKLFLGLALFSGLAWVLSGYEALK